MATDRWGVDDGYVDATGQWHSAPAETTVALVAAMGVAGAESASSIDNVRVLRQDETAPAYGPALLRLEDGSEVAIDGDLPTHLPLGYHDLHLEREDRVVRLIVSPGRCHIPEAMRTWGLTAQLYAARSRASWGIGDLADLGTLAAWTRGRGAGVLAVNPLHAAIPVLPQEPSPYFPSSKRWSNPLYLRIENVPGASDEPAIADLANAGRALNEVRRIDRDAVYALKLAALERLWLRFSGDPAFDGFVAEGGTALQEFATFCALAEHHGTGWRTWPNEHRRPDLPTVMAFAADQRDRVRFHMWLQWLLDRGLDAAGADDLVIADLAVGIDPDGADAWSNQDMLALDVRVGAPPDEFNTQGQDWGLPPFVPWRLRAAGYEPFVQMIRAGMRHARGIRIDHVMGLFRLFWIPPGAGPGSGTYVRFADRELVDIVALESVRAGAFVVGEDLGTVEADVRHRLAAAGMLSYRLVLFEPGEPEEYPALALAAVTTHDLPTVAGLWTGSDLRAQVDLGLAPNEAGTAAMRAHLGAIAATTDDAQVDDVVIGVHDHLAHAASAVVTATLDDLLAVEERPNMPGTIEGWPNWCLALPVPIDDLATHSPATAVIDALANRPASEASTAPKAGV